MCGKVIEDATIGRRFCDTCIRIRQLWSAVNGYRRRKNKDKYSICEYCYHLLEKEKYEEKAKQILSFNRCSYER